MVPQAPKDAIVNRRSFKMAAPLYLSDLFFWMVGLKAVKTLMVWACYNWIFVDVESCLLTRMKYVAIGKKKYCLLLGAVTNACLPKSWSDS